MTTTFSVLKHTFLMPWGPNPAVSLVALWPSVEHGCILLFLHLVLLGLCVSRRKRGHRAGLDRALHGGAACFSFRSFWWSLWGLCVLLLTTHCLCISEWYGLLALSC